MFSRLACLQAAQYVVDRWGALCGARGGGGGGAGHESPTALCSTPLVQQQLEVALSAEERAAGRMGEDTLEAAARDFERHGVLYFGDALAKPLLRHATQAVDLAFEMLCLRLAQRSPPLAMPRDNFAFKEVQYRDGGPVPPPEAFTLAFAPRSVQARTL